MTGVVLRCPNCGTTRAALGECDACHDAQVRYYCTNHAPGLWLDAAACPQCGARFGDPPKIIAPPTPTAPTAPSQRAAPVAPRRTPAPPPATAAPRPKFSPPARSRDADRRERAPPVIDEISPRDEDRPVRAPSWREVFRAAARARSRRTEMPPDPDYSDAAPAGRSMSGCLGRFVLLMVFLFLAFVSGVFLFGSSLMRVFLPF